MKRLALFLSALLLGMAAYGRAVPRSSVYDEVREDHNKLCGLDGVYPMTVPARVPAPAGYKAFYISHYGRHGSRYAYTDKVYTALIDLLEKAEGEGNLTPFGAVALDSLKAVWSRVRYHIGSLTPLGWEQHRFIGCTMVSSFPSVFGKGSIVDAATSPEPRCMASMSSCCMAIAKASPGASVYAHHDGMDFPATQPGNKKNPFLYEGPRPDFPFSLSTDEYLEQYVPEYRGVLGRIFKDTDKAMEGVSASRIMYWMTTLVNGNGNIPPEGRFLLDGLLTGEESLRLWKNSNYLQYREYMGTRPVSASIVEDIVKKADARVASGVRGADLRFGHDKFLLSALLVMDLDGIGTVPGSVEEIPLWFQNFRSPMGANLQFVFYRPVCGRKGDILVRILLNGEDVLYVGDLQVSAAAPYFNWADLSAFLRSRAEALL